jgi:hypothetical protein
LAAYPESLCRTASLAFKPQSSEYRFFYSQLYLTAVVLFDPLSNKRRLVLYFPTLLAVLLGEADSAKIGLILSPVQFLKGVQGACWGQ